MRKRRRASRRQKRPGRSSVVLRRPRETTPIAIAIPQTAQYPIARKTGARRGPHKRNRPKRSMNESMGGKLAGRRFRRGSEKQYLVASGEYRAAFVNHVRF